MEYFDLAPQKEAPAAWLLCNLLYIIRIRITIKIGVKEGMLGEGPAFPHLLHSLGIR